MLCVSVTFGQSTETSTRAGTPESAVNNQTATRTQSLDVAKLYIKEGRYYEAAKLADRLVIADPGDREAIAVRDEAKAGLRRESERRVAAARAQAERPGATDSERLALADAYFDAGSYAAAADAYEDLPGAIVTRDVRLRHARALAWSGNMDSAERHYSVLLKEQATPELQLEYGRLLSWMGAARASVETLRALHQSNPTDDSAVALANAYAWSGDRESGIRVLNDFTLAHPEATGSRALLAEMQSSPELRLEQVGRMIDREPYNLALRVERARLLVDAGRDSEAIAAVRFVREHATQRVEGLEEIEKRAEAHREQERARIAAELSGVDTRDVRSADRLLALAKAYTAVADYDDAIRLYENYLRLRPDDTEARIHYARVLSWDRRYAAAARQYQKLLAAHPDRADLRFEYAQVLSYDADFVDAVHMFSSLTDLSDHPRAHLYSDVPAKAHFNLGQIYRWYGWTDHAAEEQNRALALDSTYVPARQELELIRHRRPATTLEARYATATDSNDFTLNRIDLTGEKWTSQRMAWTGAVGHHRFEHAGDEVSAIALSGGGNYRWSDKWLGRARLGANVYESGFGTRPFWGLGVEWLPNIQSRTALDYNHYDLIYDVFTLSSLKTTGPVNRSLRDAITIDDFRAHYDHNTGGHWSWLGDASYGFISDDNRRAAAHGILAFRIFKEPFVAIKADGRVLSYDFRTNRYWSPDDYSSLAGVLHIGQNVRDRFHWSAELKYGKSWEGERTSDLRTYTFTGVVPINDAFDIIGEWGYGRTGRLDSVLGNNGTDFVNYWQRHWFIGVRAKKLFARDDRRGPTPYYYDNSALNGSPVMPLGEAH